MSAIHTAPHDQQPSGGFDPHPADAREGDGDYQNGADSHANLMGYPVTECDLKEEFAEKATDRFRSHNHKPDGDWTKVHMEP